MKASIAHKVVGDNTDCIVYSDDNDRFGKMLTIIDVKGRCCVICGYNYIQRYEYQRLSISSI